MSDVSRRDAVKLAAGLAVGAGMLATQEAQGQAPHKLADPLPAQSPADAMLENALTTRQGWMFAEQVVSKSDTSYDVVVTSARNSEGKKESVGIRTGTTHIFRADAGVDNFTKRGGWYWTCGKTEGQSEFKKPGALIMVLREQDGTVRWYSLEPDYRC